MQCKNVIMAFNSNTASVLTSYWEKKKMKKMCKYLPSITENLWGMWVLKGESGKERGSVHD